MKISKLFHWLYAILMLLPFVMWLGFVIVNHQGASINTTSLIFDDFYTFINTYFNIFANSPMTDVYGYITALFFDSGNINNLVIMLLNYWTSISIIYLVFDLFMYIPLLVHRWLDKGIIE